MEVRQFPMIVQAQPLEYEGNDHFYSVIRAIPVSLTTLKNMIQESFNLNQQEISKMYQSK
jgi:hypothetical protein